MKIEIDSLKFTVEDGLSDTFDVLTVDYSDGMLRRGFSVVPGIGGKDIKTSC